MESINMERMSVSHAINSVTYIFFFYFVISFPISCRVTSSDKTFFSFSFFPLIQISIQSQSNTVFCLGNTEVCQWDCTFWLNNEARQNENFMMKFTPKNT